MRLLLFLVLTVALAYLVSRLLFPPRRLRREANRRAPTVVTEEMVRDPVCQVYLPRAQAIRRRVQGQDVFFCSPGCLDKFLIRRP